jgi:hypothetical protein
MRTVTRTISEELKQSSIWTDISLEAYVVIYQAGQTGGQLVQELFGDGGKY